MQIFDLPFLSPAVGFSAKNVVLTLTSQSNFAPTFSNYNYY